jgi:putative copper export protein
MPFPLQAIILWLHLLAVMTWIGGLVFQVLVVFPMLAWAAPTGERLRFALSLEARFRVILWPAVGLALFTGLVNLMNVWYVTVVTARGISPTFVPRLSVKLGLVVGMIALQAVQQLWLYPKRVAALSSVSADVEGVPLAFRTWQRWAWFLYGALLGLAGGAVFCAVLLRH